MAKPARKHTTVEQLKKNAKRLKRDNPGLNYQEALDRAAQAAGYGNFNQARVELEGKGGQSFKQKDLWAAIENIPGVECAITKGGVYYVTHDELLAHGNYVGGVVSAANLKALKEIYEEDVEEVFYTPIEETNPKATLLVAHGMFDTEQAYLRLTPGTVTLINEIEEGDLSDDWLSETEDAFIRRSWDRGMREGYLERLPKSLRDPASRLADDTLYSVFTQAMGELEVRPVFESTAAYFDEEDAERISERFNEKVRDYLEGEDASAHGEGGPAATEGADMQEPVTEIMATVYSEDRYAEHEWNVLPWFETASDEDLQDIVDEEFFGPATERIAHDYYNEDGEVRAVMDASRFLGGMNCEVDEETASAWIKANRPQIRFPEDSGRGK